MLLAIIWGTVFEPIGASRGGGSMWGRSHAIYADLMLHASCRHAGGRHGRSALSPSQAAVARVVTACGGARRNCRFGLFCCGGWGVGGVGGGGGPRAISACRGPRTQPDRPTVAGRRSKVGGARGPVRNGDRLFVIDPLRAKAEVARKLKRSRESKSRLREPANRQAPEEQDGARQRRGRGGPALPRRSQRQTVAGGVFFFLGFFGLVAWYDAPGLRAGRYQARQLRYGPTRSPPRTGAAILPHGPTSPRCQGDGRANQANLDQRESGLDDLMRQSPEDSMVENTFFNVGEWVPAGTPVVCAAARQRNQEANIVPEADVNGKDGRA